MAIVSENIAGSWLPQGLSAEHFQMFESLAPSLQCYLEQGGENLKADHSNRPHWPGVAVQLCRGGSRRLGWTVNLKTTPPLFSSLSPPVAFFGAE